MIKDNTKFFNLHSMITILFLFFVTTIKATKEIRESKISNYECVYWRYGAKKWVVRVYLGPKRDVNGKVKPNEIYGGVWDSELDAAKQVNKICDLYGLNHKNPGIGSEPIQQKKESSGIKSNYKCVHWRYDAKKWGVQVYVGLTRDVNGKVKENRISGGLWDSELDAAKQVNKICDLNGLKHKNPGIGSEPQQNKKDKSTSVDLSHGKIYVDSLEESSKDEHTGIKTTQESHDSKKRKREDTEQNAQRNLKHQNQKINYNDFYFKSDYLLKIENSFN